MADNSLSNYPETRSTLTMPNNNTTKNKATKGNNLLQSQPQSPLHSQLQQQHYKAKASHLQPPDMSESAAFMSSQSSGQRRGSITQMALPPPKLFRDSSDDEDSQLQSQSMLQYESFHQYGSSEQDDFIQVRRASMAKTRQLSKAHLAPVLSHISDDGRILEVETSVRQETWMLLKSSVPLILTFMLQYSLTVASVFSVGKLGSTELAAVSLANLLINIICYGIIQGIASSLSTLCPQAYGRKEYTAVGLHCLRCSVLLFVVFIPISILLYFETYSFLSSIMDDLYLCQLSTNYLRRILLGVPGFILFEIFKQFLQAQGIFQASTYVLVICAPLNVILNFTLVWDKKIGLGFIGAPTAVAITNWVMATLLLLYIIFIKGKECWCGFTPKVFTNWGRTLALAGPGVLMIEAEWLAFEIITFAASRFGTDSLAAQSIVSTACVTTYQFSFAIAVAASTRIAWFVGSASKQAAWKSAQAAVLMSLASGTLMGTLLYIFRETVTSWFSTVPEVKEDSTLEDG
ncbi:unnamed protein product [Ambrosiozyma monospora]|uniref:Unnamed protein product n=1 Tax=Ambrosiozyma monospora TaxID=43982 RepID=A0A9W6YV50_AMBMO|nr:unnamed protein product [Ambrosiozyma monospora]